MSRSLAVLAMAMIAASCSEQATAPAAESPQFGLEARGDSLVKGAWISWTADGLTYSMFFSEGQRDHVREAWLQYFVINDCGGTCYDLVRYGLGSVPLADVRGGTGAMEISTDTSPTSNPDFTHFNDAGGLVAITLRQVPGTAWRQHDVGRFEPGSLLYTYNTTMEMREATVSGVVAGIEIPPNAEGWLTLSWGHSTVISQP